jgi:hypothetical protein
VIAGDYEPKPSKGRGKDKGGRIIAGDPNQGPLVKREVAAPAKRKSGDCRIKLLSLCI